MSRSMDHRQPGVKLEDLFFYFDGVERDRLDAAGLSRKAAEVLALRERLLKLSDPEFDAAMKTVKGLVTEPKKDGDDEDGPRRRRAQTLYEGVRVKAGSTGGDAGKVSPA